MLEAPFKGDTENPFFRSDPGSESTLAKATSWALAQWVITVFENISLAVGQKKQYSGKRQNRPKPLVPPTFLFDP